MKKYNLIFIVACLVLFCNILIAQQQFIDETNRIAIFDRKYSPDGLKYFVSITFRGAEKKGIPVDDIQVLNASGYILWKENDNTEYIFGEFKRNSKNVYQWDAELKVRRGEGIINEVSIKKPILSRGWKKITHFVISYKIISSGKEFTTESRELNPEASGIPTPVVHNLGLGNISFRRLEGNKTLLSFRLFGGNDIGTYIVDNILLKKGDTPILKITKKLQSNLDGTVEVEAESILGQLINGDDSYTISVLGHTIAKNEIVQIGSTQRELEPAPTPPLPLKIVTPISKESIVDIGIKDAVKFEITFNKAISKDKLTIVYDEKIANEVKANIEISNDSDFKFIIKFDNLNSLGELGKVSVLPFEIHVDEAIVGKKYILRRDLSLSLKEFKMDIDVNNNVKLLFKLDNWIAEKGLQQYVKLYIDLPTLKGGWADVDYNSNDKYYSVTLLDNSLINSTVFNNDKLNKIVKTATIGIDDGNKLKSNICKLEIKYINFKKYQAEMDKLIVEVSKNRRDKITIDNIETSINKLSTMATDLGGAVNKQDVLSTLKDKPNSDAKREKTMKTIGDIGKWVGTIAPLVLSFI